MKRSVTPASAWFLLFLCFSGSTQASAQTSSAATADPCAALRQTNFEDVPEAPAKITSAGLMDVTKEEFEGPRFHLPTGSSRVKQYCRVTGYVAPQNKFELRLPLPSDWNQNFFLSACAGFCGATNGTACNAGLGACPRF